MVQRAWRAALDGLGLRVVVTESLLSVPRMLQRERFAAVVAELADAASLAARRGAPPIPARPARGRVPHPAPRPPRAARARGAAVVPRGRPLALAYAVEELLTARRQPAMNLPLRLPQVCETKWTARLLLPAFHADQETWPGDQAA